MMLLILAYFNFFINEDSIDFVFINNYNGDSIGVNFFLPDTTFYTTNCKLSIPNYYYGKDFTVSSQSFGSEYLYLTNNNFYIFTLEDRFFSLVNPYLENITLNKFYRKKNNWKSNLRSLYSQIKANNFSNDSLENLYLLLQDSIERIDNQLLNSNLHENINFHILKNKVIELDKTILDNCSYYEFLDTIKLHSSQKKYLKNLVSAYLVDIKDNFYLDSLKKYDVFKHTLNDSIVLYFSINCQFESKEDFSIGNIPIVHLSPETYNNKNTVVTEYEFLQLKTLLKTPYSNFAFKVDRSYKVLKYYLK